MLQIKWNHKNSHLSAARQIPESNSLVLCCQSVQWSQCEGRLQFPWLYGVIHATLGATGSPNSSRWSMCRWENSILLMTWHRREPKQPGWSTSPFPQQYSQVPHLSICCHVSIRLEMGGMEIILQISTKSLLCRLVQSLFWEWPHKPTVGISLGHHNQTWSSLSQSSVEVWSFFCVFGGVCVEGRGGVRGTNSCPRLSCKSSTLQLNKLRSPRNACYSYENTDELLTREWAETGFQTVIKGGDTRIICHGRCWGPGKTDGIQTQDRIRETFTSWLTTLQNLTHFGHVCSCDVKSSIIAWLRWSRWWWPGKRR